MQFTDNLTKGIMQPFACKSPTTALLCIEIHTRGLNSLYGTAAGLAAKYYKVIKYAIKTKAFKDYKIYLTLFICPKKGKMLQSEFLMEEWPRSCHPDSNVNCRHIWRWEEVATVLEWVSILLLVSDDCLWSVWILKARKPLSPAWVIVRLFCFQACLESVLYWCKILVEASVEVVRGWRQADLTRPMPLVTKAS